MQAILGVLLLTAGAIGIGAVAILVISMFIGLFVWPIWNLVIPGLFGLASIGYWQAVGLAALCGLLFKSTNTSSKS